MSTAVALDRVSFRYGPRLPRAVCEITLDIAAGAATAILGPNGSGKSTLLHLILGLHMPQQGSVRLMDGACEPGAPGVSSRVVGLVPQDEPVAFNLNVLEYVLLGRAPYLGLLQRPTARDRAVAFQALETVGIRDLWDRSTPTLSGGERQLATMARALTQEPSILLLDEPTSHLDVANARRVVGIIRRVLETGRTVIFTTHDPNAAAAAADEVVLMRQGCVLGAGRVRETLTPASLSATYDVAISVLNEGRSRPLVELYDQGGKSWNP